MAAGLGARTVVDLIVEEGLYFARAILSTGWLEALHSIAVVSSGL